MAASINLGPFETGLKAAIKGFGFDIVRQVVELILMRARWLFL